MDDAAAKKRKLLSSINVGALIEGTPLVDDSSTHDMQSNYIFSEGFEPGATTRKLTAAILLLSGVSSGQFSVRVSEDEYALDYSVTWPNPLVDLAHLHRK